MTRKGFTTITIRKEIYEEFIKLAHYRGCSASELFDNMFKDYLIKQRALGIVDTFLRAADFTPEKKFFWKADFPARMLSSPYQAILLDPRVSEYKSTAWIRSVEYVKNVGYPQFCPLARAFLGELKIEKILIVPPKVLKERGIQDWIKKWIILDSIFGDIADILGEKKLQTFVTLEERVRNERIPDKYYDMGIYGDLAIGYLSLNEESCPLEYSWSTNKKEIDEAKDVFEALKKKELKPEEYTQFNL